MTFNYNITNTQLAYNNWIKIDDSLQNRLAELSQNNTMPECDCPSLISITAWYKICVFIDRVRFDPDRAKKIAAQEAFLQSVRNRIKR